MAKEHRVSMSTIQSLIVKAKKKPKFLEEIHAKEELWSAKETVIDAVIDRLINEDAFIDNC